MRFLFFDRDSIKDDNKPKYENYGIIFIYNFIFLFSEFDTSPPAREWCPQLIPWWGACVGQASSRPLHFRSVPAITSGPCRPLLPVRAGHYFRSGPAITSGLFQTACKRATSSTI